MSQKTKLNKYTIHYLHQREFHSIKREIFSQGIYDVELDRPDPVIVDVGAHIGLASLYWLSRYPLARIWAVEPHPSTFSLLEQNIWDNRLESQITAVPAAIVPATQISETAAATSQTMDAVKLFSDPELEWLSTASLLPQGWTGQETTTAIEVPAMTLDQLPLPDSTIDLLKLDVEGLELEVLQTAGVFLNRCHQIIIEFHPAPNTSLTELTELLTSAGFLVESQPHELGLWLVRGRR